MNRVLIAGFLLSSIPLNVGCDRKPAPSSPAPSPGNSAPAPPAKPHGDSANPPATGHGGEVIELGTATLDDLTIRASRDAGDIKAGGEAPIDVWVTTSDGKPATVAIVRFWIGAADAKGSIKAKADIEDPKQPNHWHTHAPIPETLSTESKLWVEVEKTQNAKSTTSFDLKR